MQSPNKFDIMVEDAKKALKTARNLEDLHFNQSLRNSLPSDLLKSRLCTALVLTGFGLQKKVVKVFLKLSKRSRAFIISQAGLPGFLLTRHDNILSFMHDQFSLTLQIEFEESIDVSFDQLKVICAKSDTIELKEKELRRVLPQVFVAVLRA